MAINDIPRTIWWEDGKVVLVDQSRLPLVGDLLACNSYDGVCQAIKGMAVRGAPALGVAAALAVALWATTAGEDIDDPTAFLAELDRVADEIASARPTAVNLAWGAERMKRFARGNSDVGLPELRDLILQEALAIRAEDEERNRAIGANGAELLESGSRVLTHCNAGSLATAFYGTALGVIFSAHEQGKIEGVWVDETRPVLQGARLTAWELKLAGVPFKLITDNMAASIMRAGLVDAVIVGADRIAANGDVANKIGTYGLAVLCKEHGIPFYVAAPTSTVDLTLPSGDDIVIEQRDEREVTGVTISGVISPDSSSASRAFDLLTDGGPYEVPIAKGHQMVIDRKGGAYRFDGWFRIAPPGIEVYNPAFDVTPAKYVSAIITECGVVRAPFGETLTLACEGSGAIHELG
ncbi:MAG: S-methyl-5-thioribose-1-phosphate isomerase [Actinobacteria bacterium HGW-Actinobacteria-6]|jgi:methylthioribose-1-phosphate isomerase|nr:MAG: S-methyl-5-thioribose-1-phosphate isomerase [Actinobacteria bacterium HGW-Actinobacteria-6]